MNLKDLPRYWSRPLVDRFRPTPETRDEIECSDEFKAALRKREHRDYAAPPLSTAMAEIPPPKLAESDTITLEQAERRVARYKGRLMAVAKSRPARCEALSRVYGLIAERYEHLEGTAHRRLVALCDAA